MEDSALVVDFPAQRLFTGADFLQLLAKFGVGLLETLPVAEVISTGVAGEEAEGGCEYHPDRYHCCCFVDDHALSFCWVDACSESTR